MPENETYARARLLAGRYRLARELGRGGMGIVWLADDTLVDRRVAVKELRPPPGLPDADRDLYTRRALQEARSAARIHHNNAVTLYDVLPATAADDAVYLIMELIDGLTLAQFVQRNGRLPDAAVASVGIQLLDVLEAAHGLGIVHRDIKPGNIMITAGNQVKLTDFSIAHTVGETRLTRAGTMGTQAYMAPELFNSQPITPAADLWSLGATLYYAAEGQGPFERDNPGATLNAVLLEDLPVPSCGPGLAHAISGMLQRDPVRRATIPQVRTQLLVPARPVSDPTSEPVPARGPSPSSSPPPARPPSDEVETRESPPHPDVIPARPSVRSFTNMPGRFALGLVRAVWVIGLIGGAVGAFIVAVSSGIGAGFLAFVLYCVLGFFGTFIGLLKMTRWRTLILGPSGFTVEMANLRQDAHPIAEARWEQVVRIAPFGQPAKVRLCAWVSGGESKPARLVSLCPVGSPHFPISEILTAIRSYCPTVVIEPLRDRSADSER